jgi:heme-degrading monooxygenase HmoA
MKGEAVVRFINCFEVPAGREDEFLSRFAVVNDFMAARPGYLRHRLHRSIGTEARYRFINYVEWESVEHWRAAHGEAFRALVSGPEWADLVATPGLYEVVHEREASSA